LVAASLRAPGAQPPPSENELGRFVDQNVTLSAEDEAALERARPALKRKFRATLQGPSRPAVAEPDLPKSLLTFGERKGLILPQMRTMLNMRLQIVSHRCDSGDGDLESFDWERFYEKVKDYLG
jgi:hypothetical protein